MTVNWIYLYIFFISFKIACGTAGEAQKWMEAFDHAKQQVQENYKVVANRMKFVNLNMLVFLVTPKKIFVASFKKSFLG